MNRNEIAPVASLAAQIGCIILILATSTSTSLTAVIFAVWSVAIIIGLVAGLRSVLRNSGWPVVFLAAHILMLMLWLFFFGRKVE